MPAASVDDFRDADDVEVALACAVAAFCVDAGAEDGVEVAFVDEGGEEGVADAEGSVGADVAVGFGLFEGVLDGADEVAVPDGLAGDGVSPGSAQAIL